MRPRVKICGLTREEDIMYAAEQGADALGFVSGYYDSPRNLELGRLKELVSIVPPYTTSVVVTPLSNSEIFEMVRKVRPSMLQVTGSDTRVIARLREDLGFDQVIHTLHVEKNVGDYVKQSKELSKISKALLLDSKGGGSKKSPIAGGTGVTHDWNQSKKIRNVLRPFPVILGGGLTSKNVSQAINIVGPYAVDVSSGVESSPGRKSKLKVKEFIQNAKNSFE